MSQPNQLKLSTETSQWLLANNYNPEDLNQRGKNGDTALMKATRDGLYPVVKELI
ncbi:MAG: ankyrin repeat domain-containing protein, partial [Sphaerospermopsis kisseleviana]